MIERPLVVCVFSWALAACGANEPDLKQELAHRTEGLQGKVVPLPIVRFSAPFQYEARGLPDPFYPVTVPASPNRSSAARHTRQ